jgi:hypothetical protein
MKNSTIWFYSLFVAILFTGVFGYMFNNGDQAEHLPQVYHLQNRLLYTHDFFMQEYVRQFTIRDYYAFTINLLSTFMSVEWVCFLLQLFAITFTAFGIFRLTQRLTENKLAPFVAPILALIVFRSFTVGGNAVQDVQFISSSLAVPFALYAFYKLIDGKYIAAGAFAGFATLNQPLIGIQAFMVIAGVMAIRNRKIFFGTIVYTVLAYFAAAVLMLFPLVLRQFMTPFTGDENLYYTLLYNFRNFDHYLPHLFPITDYIKFGFITLAGIALLIKTDIREAQTVRLIYVFILLGLAVYTAATELHYMYSLGKLQWFKTTVWLSIFGSILISIKLAGWWEKTILTPGVVKVFRRALPILGVGMFIVIVNSAMIPQLADKYQIGNYTKNDLTLMHEWIEKNTDINSIILTEPADNSFACEAKRSQPVSFKAIIHEPGFMLKWYTLVKEVYGITVEDVIPKKDKAMKLANSLYKERNYKEHITIPITINYRIDNVQTCQYIDNLGKVVHKQGDWVLTEF